MNVPKPFDPRTEAPWAPGTPHGAYADGDLPPAIRQCIVAVCAADARWFNEHPGETRFLRPAVAGELYPLSDPWYNVVWVVQVQLGIRVRDFVHMSRDADADADRDDHNADKRSDAPLRTWI